MTRTPRFPGVQTNKPYCSPSLSGCFLLTNQRAQKASVCGQLSALESAGDLWYSLKVLPTGQIIYPNPTAYSAFDKAETCEKNSPGWCPSWRIYNMHARYKIVVWTLKSLTLQLLVDFSWKYKNTNRQTVVPTASLPVPSAAQWGLGHLDGFRSFTPWSQVDRTQHQERWSKPERATGCCESGWQHHGEAPTPSLHHTSFLSGLSSDLLPAGVLRQRPAASCQREGCRLSFSSWIPSEWVIWPWSGHFIFVSTPDTEGDTTTYTSGPSWGLTSVMNITCLAHSLAAEGCSWQKREEMEQKSDRDQHGSRTLTTPSHFLSAGRKRI